MILILTLTPKSREIIHNSSITAPGLIKITVDKNRKIPEEGIMTKNKKSQPNQVNIKNNKKRSQPLQIKILKIMSTKELKINPMEAIRKNNQNLKMSKYSTRSQK